MPDDKLKIPDFAAKIKAKYPEYKDMNDTLLVQKIVDKYPEYAANVDMSGLKKKASFPVVGQQPKEYVSAPQSTSPISYFPSSPFYTPTLEQVRALPDNKPIPAPDLGVQKAVQDNIITGQQRQKVQSIAKNAIDEVQHIKELPKRVEEYKKKKQEAVAKAPVDNFDPQQFLQIDINGDGKDAYDKALGVTEVLKSSGVVSTKNIEDAASFKSYFGERIKQLDEKENTLREMLKGQQAKNLDASPARGDIAGQMGKPIDLQGVVKNETPQNEQEISDALNTLKEYRANLYKTADYYAKKLAKKVVPQGNNKDLGKAYGEIMNDPYSQELNRFEQKGIPIRDEDKLNQDLQGLEVRKDDLEERYQGKEKDDAYYNELYQIEQGQKDAIHKYPELKKQRIALLITQELGKDADAYISVASTGDEKAIKAISDKTGLSKKDILSISTGDLPSEGFLGNIGKGVYNAGTGILTGVNRLVGGAFGADPDRLTYINRKISESGSDIFGDNPYEHTIAPETIVNSDLSLSRNPKAGKYNYNAASIKNLAGEAIGGLLGFVGGTKGLGYLGMDERAALWTNVIASGYENRYQQAAQVLGKDASEKSKNQFALITGAIEAAAFEFLPKEKLGLNLTKKEVQEFGDIVGKTSINNINKEALTKWTEKVLQGTLKSAGEAGKVTAAMSASKIVNGILRQQLGDKNGFDEAAGILDPHKLGEEFLGLMLPLSLAEIPQGMKHSRQFKESLYDAGSNADVYRTQIKQAVELGRMPEKEGELRLKTLDALQNISSTVPETNPETNQPLTHSQKVEYTYNRVKESAVQSKKEGIKGDEALAQLYNKNAKELVDERKSILNGTQAEYQKITELYDRVKEKESHNKTLAAGTKTEGIKYLSEQALTTPNGIKNTLKGDADLTTDLIAQNEPLKIKEEISKLKEKHAKLTDQEKYEEADALDKHITLLEEGLKKAKAEPPPLDIEHEGVIVTSPTEGGNITEVSAPNEIQKANENGISVEAPIQQPEPITIGANGEEVKPEVTQEPIKPLEPKQTEEVIQPETKVSEGGGGAAEPPKEVKHDFVYSNDGDKRVSGLMRHIQEAEGISEDTKKAFKEKGIEYAIADNKESRRVAQEIINTLGTNDALQVARGEDMHPSVRSAIFAESIDNAFKAEQDAKAKGYKEAELKAAAEWASISREYDKKLTGSGQFSQYANHFYKTSSLGFVIKANAETNAKFEQFMSGREEGFKEAFEEFIKTEEGKLFFDEKVEAARKEERKAERQKRDKKIDDFFDNLKADSDKLYSAPIPPSLWNGAMDVMKVAVKAGDRVVDAVKSAIDHISKQIGDDWDKEKFRTEFEGKLSRAADDNKTERSYEDILKSKMDELKRRMDENDFSAEEYKDKKTLSDKEKAALEEYKKVKEDYDEAKKKSKEWIDKKAKQYLDQFRTRLSGMDDAQKEDVIRRAAKKLIENGALRYDEFRKIIADVMGFKELTPDQIKRAEELVKEINSLDDVEANMVNNPTRENIDKLEAARRKSIVAQLELYNMTSNKSDIVQTVKSLITGNLMGIPTLFVNLVANPIYQMSVRFPKDIIKNIGEYGLYAVTKAANNFWGSEVYNPKVNAKTAQEGYWKMGAKGLKNAVFNFKKGTENKDYFGSREYQSALAPKVAKAELQAFKRGEIYLDKNERIDRWLRKSWMGRQADFILRGMQFGDNPPRWAAEGAKAIQIAKNELKLEDVNEVDAFMLAPEKYAKKVFLKQGYSEAKANELAKEVQERIVFEGEKAVLQEDNLLSKASSYIDSGLRKNKNEGYGMSAAKGTGAILKTITFPFVKIPANFAWQAFKLAVPEVALGQAAIQYTKAFSSLKKGDKVTARKYMDRANDSFAHATLGLTMRLAAQSLVAAGYTRSSNDEDTKKREREGERTYGKQNQVNIGKIMGGSDFWVDFKYFGPFGVVLNTQSQMSDEEKDKTAKENQSYVEDLLGRVGHSGIDQLNNLVFNNGGKLVDAMKGGEKPFKDWTVNSMNTISNIFTGATYVSLSKALLPEQVRVNGDGVVEDILNNQKQRNILLRLSIDAFGGKGNPPSKISIWGEPIKNDRSISGVLGSMLGWEKDSKDIFGAILYNDYKRTGNEKFFPTVEDNKISVGGKQVTLSREEQDRLNTLVGQARKTLVRAFVYDQVQQYDDKPYSQLTDSQKMQALKSIYDLGKEIGYKQFKQEKPKYENKIDYVEDVKKEIEGVKDDVFKLQMEQNYKK